MQTKRFLRDVVLRQRIELNEAVSLRSGSGQGECHELIGVWIREAYIDRFGCGINYYRELPWNRGIDGPDYVSDPVAVATISMRFDRFQRGSFAERLLNRA